MFQNWSTGGGELLQHSWWDAIGTTGFIWLKVAEQLVYPWGICTFSVRFFLIKDQKAFFGEVPLFGGEMTFSKYFQ